MTTDKIKLNYETKIINIDFEISDNDATKLCCWLNQICEIDPKDGDFKYKRARDFTGFFVCPVKLKPSQIKIAKTFIDGFIAKILEDMREKTDLQTILNEKLGFLVRNGYPVWYCYDYCDRYFEFNYYSAAVKFVVSQHELLKNDKA